MKVEENIYLSKLFDAYGALLSEGQRVVFAYYLNDDFTITEIAENLKVSRQAVMDSVSKAEKKLRNYEERLQFVRKLELLSEENRILNEKLSKKG